MTSAKLSTREAICRAMIPVALVVGIGCSSTSGQAQAPPPAAPTGDSDEAEALVSRIAQNDSQLVRLTSDLPTVEGEEAAILLAQVNDLVQSQQGDLAQLVGIVATRAAGGADVTLLRGRTEHLLRRGSRRLRGYIDRLQDDLEQDAGTRNTLAPNETQLFEHRMAERTRLLDQGYIALVQLAGEIEATGFDAADERSFLEAQLAERGERLYRLVELTNQQLDEYRQLVARAPDDAELRAELFATQERYDSNKTSLLGTIHLMKTLGMDYVDLEVRTVEVTGEVAPEAVDLDVAAGLVERFAQGIEAFFLENGLRLLIQLVLAVGTLLASWGVAMFVARIVRRSLGATRVGTSQLFRQMVAWIVSRVVLVLGLILVLSQLGISLGPVLAGLGIAGVVVGFALQDTLANFAAGFMLLAYRPYDIGDLVEAAGVSGTVRSMNLVSTRILTLDHQTLIVPNNKIWGDVIRNVTAQPSRRVDLVFGVSYVDDIAKVEAVLRDVVHSHDKVLDDPSPVVRLHTLNDSSVDFVVRPWVRTVDYWDVYWDITRTVKLRFDEEGISIPYPQRDVHLIRDVAASVP